MLSIRTLSGSSGGQLSTYFEKESSMSDYWAKEARHSTQWLGRGADELGLKGSVDQKTFEQTIEGKLPNGFQMAHGARGQRRLGYDLTFSAPKSVSLQGLVAGDSRVLSAHDAAVQKALNWTEKTSAQTRIKQQNQIRIEKTGNLTAAAFRHETSRNLDPQLHTHCVVLNSTQDKNGRWRALDSKEIYRNKLAAGAVYRGELARELQKLGYDIKITDQKKGLFEIKGYDTKKLESFSTRRAEIEKAMSRAGFTSAKAAERAALNTRKGKQSLSEGQKAAMRGSWKQTAQDAGIKFPEAGAPAARLTDAQQVNRARKIAGDTLSELGPYFRTPQQVRASALQRSVGTGVAPATITTELGNMVERQARAGKLVITEDGRVANRAAMQRGTGNNLAKTLGWKLVPAPVRQVRTAAILAKSVMQGSGLAVKMLLPVPSPIRLALSVGKALKTKGPKMSR